MLIGFDRQCTTQRQLAMRPGVRVTSTVFFFEATGAQVADPIVGAMLDDFYGVHLDAALATAKDAIVAAQ